MTSAEQLAAIIKARRSVRRFVDAPVPKEMLLSLIELAAWAPSAGNRQDWSFIVVTSADVKQNMSDIVRSKWEQLIERRRDSGLADEIARYANAFSHFAGAPAVIAVAAKHVDAFQLALLGDDAAMTVGSAASAAMAAQNLMLAAHAMGLGTCCLTGPLAAQQELKALLGMGRRHDLVCLIALGRPAEEPPAPPRKPTEQIARFIE